MIRCRQYFYNVNTMQFQVIITSKYTTSKIVKNLISNIPFPFGVSDMAVTGPVQTQQLKTIIAMIVSSSGSWDKSEEDC